MINKMVVKRIFIPVGFLMVCIKSTTNKMTNKMNNSRFKRVYALITTFFLLFVLDVSNMMKNIY